MPHAPELGRLGEMGMAGRPAEPWVMAQQHQIRQESATAGWANEFNQVPQQNMSGSGIQQMQPQRPDCMLHVVFGVFVFLLTPEQSSNSDQHI